MHLESSSSFPARSPTPTNRHAGVVGPLAGLWLAGNGEENGNDYKGYIGITIRIHSFIPS